MDKNTLSNYGWIVIAVLVLSVMIALATPFGSYIEQGVRATTEGLFDTSKNAVNSAFEDLDVQMDDQTFEEGYTGGQAIQLDTLKIFEKEYTYEVGMTWGEWIESKYNIDNFINSGHNIVGTFEGQEGKIHYGTPHIYDLNGIRSDCYHRNIRTDDEIVKDEEYHYQPIDEGELDGSLFVGDKYFKTTDNDGKIIYNQVRYTYGEEK